MTATEKLRAMLDERGVEYITHDDMGACETSWNGFTAYQLTPTSKLIMHPTPEQAIAATLGSGTCENNAPEYLDFLCSECGFVHYHSDENDTGDGNNWRFCPNCGRVIKR